MSESRHDSARVTEGRRPHTIYLTSDLWRQIERRHLQIRLNSADPPSKIEFIEDLLRRGLNRDVAIAAPPAEAPARPTSDPQSQPRSGQPDPAEASREQIPPRSSSRVVSRQSQRPSQRSSPLTKLLKASDPGRPAPIRSAADRPQPLTNADDRPEITPGRPPGDPDEPTAE